MLILNSIQNYLYATFYLSLFKENENEGKLDWEIKEIKKSKEKEIKLKKERWKHITCGGKDI